MEDQKKSTEYTLSVRDDGGGTGAHKSMDWLAHADGLD